MSRKLKKRSDLKLEESNFPKPVEFDYSKDIKARHFNVLDIAMAHRMGISPEGVSEALDGGILVSGEDW